MIAPADTNTITIVKMTDSMVPITLPARNRTGIINADTSIAKTHATSIIQNIFYHNDLSFVIISFLSQIELGQFIDTYSAEKNPQKVQLLYMVILWSFCGLN